MSNFQKWELGKVTSGVVLYERGVTGCGFSHCPTDCFSADILRKEGRITTLTYRRSDFPTFDELIKDLNFRGLVANKDDKNTIQLFQLLTIASADYYEPTSLTDVVTILDFYREEVSREIVRSNSIIVPMRKVVAVVDFRLGSDMVEHLLVYPVNDRHTPITREDFQKHLHQHHPKAAESTKVSELLLDLCNEALLF